MSNILSCSNSERKYRTLFIDLKIHCIKTFVIDCMSSVNAFTTNMFTLWYRIAKQKGIFMYCIIFVSLKHTCLYYTEHRKITCFVDTAITSFAKTRGWRKSFCEFSDQLIIMQLYLKQLTGIKCLHYIMIETLEQNFRLPVSL